MTKEIIYPYILCGGSGSRLWPLSRRSNPKQFLSLVSDKSLLQETCLRLRHQQFALPAILTGEDHRFLAAEQLGKLTLNRILSSWNLSAEIQHQQH
ncbi:MAG: sugar phosphate nucleotidyltransferase [Methyloligellaceae bacterium]